MIEIIVVVVVVVDFVGQRSFLMFPVMNALLN